jgi:predicted Zn-dependent protease
MAEKTRRVRRKRKSRPARRVRVFSAFGDHLSPLRIAILIGTVAVAFVFGTIFFSYTSDLYNAWRQKRLLHRATLLLSEGNLNEAMAVAQQANFDEAMKIAKEALRIQPDSLPAFYVLAEAAEKRSLQESVSWRAQIARLLPHDLDSQLNLASAALRFGQLDIARKALDNVYPSDRDKAAFHVVAGWLARAEGNFAEQEQQFAAAVRKEPGNDLYQFNLAALQIRSPEKEKSANARATLDRLSKQTSFRTGALRALLNDAVDRNDFAAADPLAQQLQMSQQVTFSDYLLCLNFYRKLDDKKFEALLKKVKPVAARDPLDLALLMDWMNSSGLSAEVLDWTDRLSSSVTTHPPVAVAVAEAFAGKKNWSRLKRWTRGGSWVDEDYLRLAYQALAARESHQSIGDAEFASLWRAAERDANDQPDREIKLARLATKWNLSIEADELWSRVSRNPSTRREALDSLYRLYRGNNEIRKIYDVLQRLHESSPNEPAITANLARLGLTIDQNTVEAQQLAKEAYDRAPNDVNCAVTYAFSLYNVGRTNEGLDIVKKLPPDQLHDPHAAVYVALILLDENQSDLAREYVEAAERGPIYLEEKKLLDEAKAKLVSSSPSPAPSVTPTPASSPTAGSASAPSPAATSPPLP